MNRGPEISRVAVLLVLAAALGLAGACDRSPPLNRSRATWEPVYFQAIDELTTRAGWEPLRNVQVPPGSKEVRIWIGFGLTSLQGIRLQRSAATATGHYAGRPIGREALLQELSPRSGWSSLWSRLDALGVRTLPDDSTLPNPQLVADGVSYVVEVRDERGYRNYRYGNPQYQSWPEAKRMIEIVNLLADELDTPAARPSRVP